MLRYARVIVGINTAEVDRVFDYLVPVDMEITEGVRVIVPFGRRNAKTEGYVLSFSDETDVPSSKMKGILEVLDGGRPLFTLAMLKTAEWMKERYFCTLSQCLQAMMPAGIRTKSRWFLSLREGADLTALKGGEKVLAELLAEGEIPLQEAEEALGSGYQNAAHNLQEKGILLSRQELHRAEYKKEMRYYSLHTAHPQWREVKEKAEREKRLEGQRRLFVLLAEKECSLEEMKAAGIALSPIKTLLAKGILTERREEQKRDVFDWQKFQKTDPFHPTAEQEAALKGLAEEWETQEKHPVLLHGITGSGKTEIYLQLIAKALAEGKQAIVLVPEISLTPQILERFISRFGSRVSVTHSRLSAGERLDQWKKARDGEISVMIGPRSALFTPFAHLGVIILDEVHENSYLSDITPKYDAREVAEVLAKETEALLVMGSATPDFGTYHRALSDAYRLLELKERTGGGKLPQTAIVDMRKELEEGNRSPFSKQLQKAIQRNLEKKEQTMLCINRRGHSTFVSCRSCGYVMACPDCGINYTYHAADGSLQCHYCGKTVENPKICPACGSKYIRHFGAGTQKVEEEVKRLFPQARVLRMDLDTTMGKGSHGKILEAFGKGEADVLVGTQLIAKGHDFPNVTLMGIIAADTTLHTGQYTAAETAFQLITQAAGRAGRSEKEGLVIIQTYEPESSCIRHAAQQDFIGFYQEEIQLRELLGYPPFGVFFSVVLTAEEEKLVREGANKLTEELNRKNKEDEFLIMGPVSAYPYFFRGEYRMRLILQGTDEENLAKFVLESVEKLKKETKNALRFNLTLNPRNIV